MKYNNNKDKDILYGLLDCLEKVGLLVNPQVEGDELEFCPARLTWAIYQLKSTETSEDLATFKKSKNRIWIGRL